MLKTSFSFTTKSKRAILFLCIDLLIGMVSYFLTANFDNKTSLTTEKKEYLRKKLEQMIVDTNQQKIIFSKKN